MRKLVGLAGYLWEHQIQLSPILGRDRALAGPIRIVVDVIGNLRGPEAGDVAIVDVAFHRLAQPAVPPAESTSQPGENARAHPMGTWGRCARILQQRHIAVGGCFRGVARLAPIDCIDASSFFVQLLEGASCGFPFGESFQELRILRANRAVNTKTAIGPIPDPIAIVKVRMAGVAVAHKSFVMAAART